MTPTLQRPPQIRPTGSDNSNLLELRLMHHYTKTTCAGQTYQPMVSLEPALSNSVWGFEIPQIAFSSDLVLNALLALSALNLLSHNPTERVFAMAARYYFNRALIKQRAALDRIDCQTAEPVFIAGVLFAHYTWLSGHSIEWQEPYKADLQTFEMCQGSRALVREFAPCINKYYVQKIVGTEVTMRDVAYDKQLMDSLLLDMETLLKNAYDRNNALEIRDVYQKVAEDILATCHLLAEGIVEDSVVEQRIVTVFHRVSPLYRQMLGKHEPITVALHARNTALLSILEDSPAWWIHGVGEDKTARKQIHGLCSLIPPDYLWTMDWPLKILSDGRSIASRRRQSTIPVTG